ncbi:MAG: response regulator [Deltaproteobacteria bacterium]|nr:response regulator [Deltaproteobacteria bacterium]
MTDPSEKNILVVEDEPDVLFFLQAALEDAGFNVVTASDGDEAMERMKESVPDFISLDLVMPRKSGIRFLHELRRNKEWARVPVLIVTAHARDDLAREDLKEISPSLTLSGPQVYLEKPVKAGRYVALVKQALGMPVDDGRLDKENMKNELKKRIDDADPDALQKALALLKNKSKS